MQIKVIASTKVENNHQGYCKLDEWIKKKRRAELDVFINMEATGVYHEEAAYYLNRSGYLLSVVQPTKGKQYAKSLDAKSKTDKIDARMLAQMGLERNLTLWKEPDSVLRKIKRLTRERISLIRERNAITNQIHALKHEFDTSVETLKRHQQRVALINEQLKAIELQLQELVAEEKILSEKIKNVASIPGISFITAVSVISEADGFTNIENVRHLVSYVGLDVVMKESGTLSWKPRISKRGNAYIRSALYFNAVCSIVHNKTISNYHQRLKEKGKKGKMAIIPLERKLLIWIYALYKNNAIFDEQYLQKKCSPTSAGLL